MKFIIEGLKTALILLKTGDSQVINITMLTLKVCGIATLLSVIIGVPIGIYLALREFPGRRIIVTLVNVGMGLPPVVVGLLVSIMLWRYGPLGFLGLMYTPTAIVIAQAVIASPLVIGLTMSAIQSLDPNLAVQIKALGATKWQLMWILISEARLGLLAAVIAGFGGVVSEVGAAMMVGGNVKDLTRVLTTAISLHVSRGDFGMAIALSIILLLLSFMVTYILTTAQQRRALKWTKY
jgi:tungstate transport system permease protein